MPDKKQKHYIATMVIGVHVFADTEAEAADVIDEMEMVFTDPRDSDALGTTVIDKELAVLEDLIEDNGEDV